MSSEARVAKFHAPEILFGFGALPEAATAAMGLGARRPLVVTDPGLQRTPWPDVVVDALRAHGAHPVVWSDVRPNPRATQVLGGAETYRTSGCDVVVAVGGGSVIDAAKGVALVVSNGGHVLQYEGVDRVRLPLPPIVAVPTTAGSGADVSQFCVINDADRGTKVTLASRSLVPEVAVIDPATHATVPADINVATATDVLSHGVEAFFSRAAGPLTDSHALRSVTLCVRALDRLAAGDAHGREQLEQMALASLEAGMAFSNAVLGAVHAMSHPVGGRYDSSHGRINGVLLPHVVRHNGVTLAPARVGDLARAAGVTAGSSGPTTVERIADRFGDLAEDIGISGGLSALGVRTEDIPTLAEHALADLCMATNPRPVTVDDVDRLYREAS